MLPAPATRMITNSVSRRSGDLRKGQRIMSKLAVFFPGIGYTVDKPLMYYSRKLAAEIGYEIRLLSYSGFPEKKRGDDDRMQKSVRIAIDQSREQMKDLDLSAYEDVLFIGKSIGTIASAVLYSESAAKDRIRLILYTPLEETFSLLLGNTIVFTGSNDPWVGKNRIPELCREHYIPCRIIPGGNHSLETGNTFEDMNNLLKVMADTRTFILGESLMHAVVERK